MYKIKIAILSVLISGCTTIDTQVKDWPKLEIRKHELSFFGIQGKCWAHMPFVYKALGGFALACAEIDFDKGTCDIYHMQNPTQTDLDHEISHCNGGDHNGILQAYSDSKRGEK